MPFAFYLSDGLMLAFALAAAASAVVQSRGQVVPRWTLLLPGVLASIATVSTMIFPHPRDLLELEMWTAGVIGFLVGAARGQLMGMESDLNWGLVRLRYTKDELWVALVFVLFAFVHFVIEMRLLDVSPFMASGVLAMTVTGSYLFGRSLIGWIRAGRTSHVDLRD
jgi:hypothetical protein